MSTTVVSTGKCEYCGSALTEEDRAEQYGYCVACRSPRGKMVEIMNFLNFTCAGDPELEYFDEEGASRSVKLPREREPMLFHETARRLFPSWDRLIDAYKRMKSIRYMTREDFRGLLKYCVSKTEEKTYEQMCITEVEQVVTWIEADVMAAESDVSYREVSAGGESAAGEAAGA